jgi:lipid II:glycine glycyltransferase (peptidoglycan interpeptide bridge formation enzyme)
MFYRHHFIKINSIITDTSENDFLNRRERKVMAKLAKQKHCFYFLCDPGDKSQRTLRLNDF